MNILIIGLATSWFNLTQMPDTKCFTRYQFPNQSFTLTKYSNILPRMILNFPQLGNYTKHTHTHTHTPSTEKETLACRNSEIFSAIFCSKKSVMQLACVHSRGCSKICQQTTEMNYNINLNIFNCLQTSNILCSALHIWVWDGTGFLILTGTRERELLNNSNISILAFRENFLVSLHNCRDTFICTSKSEHLKVEMHQTTCNESDFYFG